MKTIALFGATGQTGRLFLAAALAAGHHVRALVRDPARLPTTHPHLQVLTGDVLDGAAVARTVAGADLVVSLLGHGKRSRPSLQSKGVHYMTKAMLQHEVRRIISLGSTAIAYERDEPRWTDKLRRLLRSPRARRLAADAQRHARVLLTSGVAWEIVRVPRLTDGPARGGYRLGWVGAGAGTELSRADLADFLVRELDTDERLFQMPVVSY